MLPFLGIYRMHLVIHFIVSRHLVGVRQESKIILPTLFSLDPEPVTLMLTYPLILYQNHIFGMIVTFFF